MSFLCSPTVHKPSECKWRFMDGETLDDVMEDFADERCREASTISGDYKRGVATELQSVFPDEEYCFRFFSKKVKCWSACQGSNVEWLVVQRSTGSRVHGRYNLNAPGVWGFTKPYTLDSVNRKSCVKQAFSNAFDFSVEVKRQFDLIHQINSPEVVAARLVKVHDQIRFDWFKHNHRDEINAEIDRRRAAFEATVRAELEQMTESEQLDHEDVVDKRRAELWRADRVHIRAAYDKDCLV